MEETRKGYKKELKTGVQETGAHGKKGWKKEKR
jgi:hypothetical protein